jgi:hypothetical protein
MRRSLLAWLVLVLGLGLGLVVSACGGTPPQAARSPDPATEPPKPEGDAAEPDSEPSTGAASEPSTGDTAPRTVKYIMTTAGLEVEVEGVRFMPKVAAIKSGNGWGVRVTVSAKVVDEEAHSLLDPKNGPLAFAGSIDRGVEVLRIGDKRDGDGEKLIGPGEKIELVRDWPGKSGEKPLAAGQTLTLEVGLWGLGPDADQRRAVRDFFQVKMRAADKGKPIPVITPPPSANP